MAQRKHKWAAVMVLVIVLLASCSMNIFASGSPESTGTGSSGTSGGTYSSSSIYSNAVTAQLDGENLYPSTYSEEDRIKYDPECMYSIYINALTGELVPAD